MLCVIVNTVYNRLLQEANSLLVNVQPAQRQNLLIVVSAQRPQLHSRHSCKQTTQATSSLQWFNLTLQSPSHHTVTLRMFTPVQV